MLDLKNSAKTCVAVIRNAVETLLVWLFEGIKVLSFLILTLLIGFQVIVKNIDFCTKGIAIIQENLYLFLSVILLLWGLCIVAKDFIAKLLSNKAMISNFITILAYILIFVFTIIANDRYCYLGAIFIIALNSKIIGEPVLNFLIQMFGKNPNSIKMTPAEQQQKEIQEEQDEQREQNEQINSESNSESLSNDTNNTEMIVQPVSATSSQLYENRRKAERRAVRYINNKYHTKFLYGYKLITKDKNKSTLAPDGYYIENDDVYFLEIVISRTDNTSMIINRFENYIEADVEFFKNYSKGMIGHFYQAVLVSENFTQIQEDKLRQQYNDFIDNLMFEQYEFKLFVIRSNELGF